MQIVNTIIKLLKSITHNIALHFHTIRPYQILKKTLTQEIG